MTPLMLAASCKSLDCVTVLLELGADPDVVQRLDDAMVDKTAESIAKENGSYQVCMNLLYCT